MTGIQGTRGKPSMKSEGSLNFDFGNPRGHQLSNFLEIQWVIRPRV